jgi:glyoxylase-like metal-dependent hydrolase (beta-lactamase superfamily II)
LAALGLPRLALSQQAGVIAITDNITLLQGFGGNVLAFGTGDGLLLVDSGAAAVTGPLADTLAGLDAGSVHTLFNTHWHPDQVGGNAWFGSRGASIIAHDKTRQYLSTPYYLFDEDRYREPMPADAHPDQAFYTSGELTAGGEKIEYGYLQSAHTNADIYVRFMNANVIAVGDVVSPEVDPGFDWFSGGWIGGRVDALNLLLDISDADTKFIPSYGAVIGRAHVEAERDLMQFLYDTLVDQIRMGFDYEDSLATGIMDNLPRQLDDPAKFLYDAHKGLWAHHNKLEPNIV